MSKPNKTIPTDASVQDYLRGVEEKRRADIQWVYETMCSISKVPPKMWGKAIVGFDEYHYKYASGREGDFFKMGFSSRKQNITLYIMPGFERFDDLMRKLGKYTTGKSCLYIKKLAYIDRAVLIDLLERSYEYMNNKYSKQSS